MIEFEGLVQRAKEQIGVIQAPYERVPFQVEKDKPISGRIEAYTGHGLQKVGMGKELYGSPIAKQLYKIASEERGIDVAELSFNGPAEELNRTENAQIAIVTLAAIYKRIMIQRRPNLHGRFPRVALGQSLGEFSAAYEAECWGDPNDPAAFRKFARILVERGKIFQDVSDKVDGKLAVLNWDGVRREGSLWPTPLDLARVSGIEDYRLQMALDISDKQIVLGGKREDVEKFLEGPVRLFRYQSVTGAISEASSGPFHTNLMNDAEKPVRKILKDSEIKHPKSLVVANTKKEFLSRADDVEEELGDLTTMPVLGREMDDLIAENCRGIMYFVGGGRTLASAMFDKSTNGQKKSFTLDKKIAVTAGIGLGAVGIGGIILGSRAVVNKRKKN